MIMQGDSYYLEIKILKSTGEQVTEDDVRDVEIAVGNLIKRYAAGEVFCVDGLWEFPLSQEETFRLIPAKVKVQVRVAWKGGGVEGIDLGDIRVDESISKGVLGE